MTRNEAIAELARDGAWTDAQLRERLERWGIASIDHYLSRQTVQARPTGFSKTRRLMEIVRPNGHGRDIAARLGVSLQLIRTGELEHALGLAELRWTVGARYRQYTAQDGLGRLHRHGRAIGGAGLGDHLADGAVSTPKGLVLLEYDHGRYTSTQVREKLASFERASRWSKDPIVGAVWGAPSARRAAWLRSVGVEKVVVVEASQWLK